MSSQLPQEYSALLAPVEPQATSAMQQGNQMNA
jgi:hypothetical protein